MIDIKELRIGNYITDQWNSTYTSIESINKEGIGLVIEDDGNWSECASRWIEPIIRIDVIFGIPLTEEILLKCGMKTTYDELIKLKEYQLVTNKFYIAINCEYTNYRKWNVHIDNCDFQTIGSGECDYLHQLQNLVLDVTGTELEIKL